jgi:hypothetical protein
MLAHDVREDSCLVAHVVPVELSEALDNFMFSLLDEAGQQPAEPAELDGQVD